MTNDVIDRARANCAKAEKLIRLCEAIESALDEALSKLSSASNWGIWDLLGGGFISTMIKHNRIDDAKAQISAAQPMIERLQRELHGLSIDFDSVTTIGGFAVFADYFFDGLFADLYVQGKISDLRADVEDMLEQVERAESALREVYEHEAAVAQRGYR